MAGAMAGAAARRARFTIAVPLPVAVGADVLAGLRRARWCLITGLLGRAARPHHLPPLGRPRPPSRSVRGAETFADGVARLPQFLDEIDNTKRLHPALGYPSPVRSEEITTRKAA